MSLLLPLNTLEDIYLALLMLLLALLFYPQFLLLLSSPFFIYYLAAITDGREGHYRASFNRC